MGLGGQWGNKSMQAGIDALHDEPSIDEIEMSAPQPTLDVPRGPRRSLASRIRLALSRRTTPR